MLTDGEPPEPEAQAGSPEWLSNGDAVLAPDIPKAIIVESSAGEPLRWTVIVSEDSAELAMPYHSSKSVVPSPPVPLADDFQDTCGLLMLVTVGGNPLVTLVETRTMITSLVFEVVRETEGVEPVLS